MKTYGRSFGTDGTVSRHQVMEYAEGHPPVPEVHADIVIPPHLDPSVPKSAAAVEGFDLVDHAVVVEHFTAPGLASGAGFW